MHLSILFCSKMFRLLARRLDMQLRSRRHGAAIAAGFRESLGQGKHSLNFHKRLKIQFITQLGGGMQGEAIGLSTNGFSPPMTFYTD